MRIVILSKPAVVNGIQHRKGDVVQVADNEKPQKTVLKDTFDESCIKTVLKGGPLIVKVKEVQDGKA